MDSDLPEPVVCQMTPSRRSSRRGGSRPLCRGLADGEELVVLRALLGDLLIGDLERDEVADVGRGDALSETVPRQERALSRWCPARCARRRSTSRVRTIRCRRPDAVARAHAVADDAERVELEDLRDVDR